jgi:CRP/FNR family transcriptional regulator
MLQKCPENMVKNVSCRVCGLSEFCVSHGLTNDELDKLDTITKNKIKLDKGSFLFQAGDSAKAIFAVRSGSFKTTMNIRDGVEQVTGFHFPGHVFGLESVGSQSHSYSTVALETSTVCELPMDEFDELCGSMKSLRHQMLRLIGDDLHRDSHMILSLGQMSGVERIASFLMDLSECHQERGLSPIEFNLTMSRGDIANYLGIAVETLSRQFSKLHDDGVVKISRKNIQILQWDTLCDLAHESYKRNENRKTG